MKKNIKALLWRIVVISVVVVVALPVGYYVFRRFVPPTRALYSRSDYACNPYNIPERVGSFPYVFVAYVEETYDMHTTKFYRRFPDYLFDLNEATTECTLRVLKNIQGELRTDITITYYKSIGINVTLSYLVLENGDVLPEKGKTYIFLGSAREDNTFGGGGPNSTVELEKGITVENLEESEVYQKFVEACKNPIRNDTIQSLWDNMLRHMSEFDVNFDGTPGQLLPDSPSLERYEAWRAENESKWAEKEASRLAAENAVE